MNVEKFRKSASLKSKGTSAQEIHHAILQYIKSLPPKDNFSLLDIGCGQATFLQQIKQHFPSSNLTGCDLTPFVDLSAIPAQFISHDLNSPFPSTFDQYDIVTAIEVIEHLENSRHFVRQITKLLRPNGRMILSTPNLDSILNILTFALKGHHNAFGPRDYPAHINPVSRNQLLQIVGEIEELQLTNVIDLNNGRIPGTDFKWRRFFPFLKGKRFSDNYTVIATKRQYPAAEAPAE